MNFLFQTFSDGKWHALEFAMSKNSAVLIIDNEKAETKRILEIATGPYYMVGGGIYGQVIDCFTGLANLKLRIKSNLSYLPLTNLSKHHLSQFFHL
jgi:hypothetical protein